MKKIIYSLIITTVLVLLFLDRCTTHNISTNDFFKPKSYKNFNPNKPDDIEKFHWPESIFMETLKPDGN